MTNFTRTFLSIVILLTVTAFAVDAQTSVSGGIYSNTTWTKANSPYIVTDTVVVFPGYTLTIEPGVTVKFADNQQLELRQAELIANGTASDSITFTSNSLLPTQGMYAGIYLNGGSMTSQFQYCNIEYAYDGLGDNTPLAGGFTAKHCKVMYNNIGIGGESPNSLLDSCDVEYNSVGESGFYNVTNCYFTHNSLAIDQGFATSNCIIDSNGTGIYENSGSVLNCSIRYDTVGIVAGNPVTINNCVITHDSLGIEPGVHLTITNCIIDSNNIGIAGGIYESLAFEYISSCEIKYNGIGIVDVTTSNDNITENDIEDDSIGIYLTNPDSIYCNTICNNTTYGLKYVSSINTNCVANNYWCTTDSASIAALIYDGYENVNYGLVTFIPFDTVSCSGVPSGIPIIEARNFSVNIYPDPASDNFTLLVPENIINGKFIIYSMLGDIIYTSTILKQETSVDVSTLARGVYIIEVWDGDNVSREKFIRE